MKISAAFLNGEWVQTANTMPVTNPATGETFGMMSMLDRAQVAQAVRDAAAAFSEWRKTTGKMRGEWLQKISIEVERRGEEIARTITLENGKPISQSRAEVAMTIDHLRWFAEEARRTYGRIIPHQVEGKRHLVLKQPMGVVAAISPWNFPLVLGIRKAAPALAAGCTVVLKPARQTPFSSVLFSECVAAVGLPKGVFQLVAGKASEIGDEFLGNPLCRKISFTGSTDVGKLLIRGAADGVKALSLELGGQAPVLVFEDADLERAVDGAMLAKFRNTGQSCIAANRIYVQRSVYARFVELFVEKTQALRVGDGLDESVQIGPLIDQAAIAKAEEHIEDAVRRGAKVLCGGRRMPGPGFFFQPTVLGDVPDGGLCLREETFAPVAPMAAFDTEEEAVGKANSTPFGLSSYVFTSNLSRAFRLMESIESGMMGLNDGVPTATQAPFGGVKQSGWGRELGSEGIDAFLDTKHVSLVL